MKDYLGHEIRVGDKVVTMVMTNGRGMEFVIAKVDYMTRKRLYLCNWETNERCLKKEFTTPDKTIRLESSK